MEPSETLSVLFTAIATVSLTAYGAWWYFFGSDNEE